MSFRRVTGERQRMQLFHKHRVPWPKDRPEQCNSTETRGVLVWASWGGSRRRGNLKAWWVCEQVNITHWWEQAPGLLLHRIEQCKNSAIGRVDVMALVWEQRRKVTAQRQEENPCEALPKQQKSPEKGNSIWMDERAEGVLQDHGWAESPAAGTEDVRGSNPDAHEECWSSKTQHRAEHQEEHRETLPRGYRASAISNQNKGMGDVICCLSNESG